MKKSLLTLAFAAASYCASAQTTSTATPTASTATPTASAATPTASAAAPTASTATPMASAAAVVAPAGYAAMLGATITEVMSTGDPVELRSLAGKLERAATVAPADWLPRYYQAYALLINVFQSKEDGDAKDKTLDQAEAALAQARKLGGDESELLALQAYVYQARLGVSPMLRSRQYSSKVMEAVAEAKRLNPANPRPYLVGANNVNFTPKMFGGGPEAARPLYEEAKTKYDAYQPTSPLLPNWGKGQLLGRLKQYEPTAAAQTAK